AIESEGDIGLRRLKLALADGRIGTRGRLHAIWILVHLLGDRAIERLFPIARSDPEPQVRAQAVRAIAELSDPVLARHGLDAEPGNVDLAGRIAALSDWRDRRLQLEIVVALGRLRWSGAADWLKESRGRFDPALSHAAIQLLRRSSNWPAVLRLLD